MTAEHSHPPKWSSKWLVGDGYNLILAPALMPAITLTRERGSERNAKKCTKYTIMHEHRNRDEGLVF